MQNQAQQQPPASMYDAGIVPQEIKKWNWGAFFYNIFWGIGNRTYLPLLCLIPFLNIVWVFVCGAKGNEWAWKSGEYSSASEFLKCQASWNRAGLVAILISIVLVIIYVAFFAAAVAAVLDAAGTM